MKSPAWSLAAAALLLVGSARGATANGSDRADYLERLHDGRFAAAEATAPASGTSAEQLFFASFITYWKLVFDDENTKLQVVLENQLDATAEAASRKEDDPRIALWGGNSHLLLAQLRAWQRRPLSAAFEAKRAKKLLEAAVQSGASAADASFGLGTYNYMADMVPSTVKGLRAILGLPKGDRAKGLEQLELAAASSGAFAVEARILLLTIYANRHERLYDKAIAERDRLLQQAPNAIASLYASARLDLALGRNEPALAALARAEARARELGDVDPVVLRCIDLLRARGEFASLRPDLAAATARAAIASGRGLSLTLTEDFKQIAAASDKLMHDIDWAAVPTQGGAAEKAQRLSALAGDSPDRPFLALLAGDASLRAGQPEDASRWLEKASSTTLLPPALRAGCQLRQGQAADLLGQRARALDFYKRAAQAPGFSAKDAAHYYLKTPYRSGA